MARKSFKRKIVFCLSAVLLLTVFLSACNKYDASLPFYDMDVTDLSVQADGISSEYAYLFDSVTVAMPDSLNDANGKEKMYLGHPDTVLLDNGNILAAYPKGHGRGETVLMISKDKGLSWQDLGTDLPSSFKKTMETPTLYKLDFTDGSQKLIMISGRPKWIGVKGSRAEGFDVSLSQSTDENGRTDGMVWGEHENFFGPNAKRSEYRCKAGKWDAIVAMASLTRLKENGAFADKWMGLFHNRKGVIFKTYLTFDENGAMQWSYPEEALPDYKKETKKYFFCEPEVVRSPDGGELAMLMRTNKKNTFSYVTFSTDEGKSWSKPQTMSRELTGERHKAEYDPTTGKLVITYRAINWKVGQECKKSAWFSRGWLAWVGDYEDLKKGADGKGDYVIKLAHTYLDGQTAPETRANADTGYAGLTIDEDGLVVALSYGRFGKDDVTYIIAKRFKLADIEAIRA